NPLPGWYRCTCKPGYITMPDGSCRPPCAAGYALAPDGSCKLEFLVTSGNGVKLGSEVGWSDFVSPGAGGLTGAGGIAQQPGTNAILVASAGSRSVKRYNKTSGAYLDDLINGMPGAPYDLRVTPDGSQLWVTFSGGLRSASNASLCQALMYKVASGAYVGSTPAPCSTTELAPTSSGQYYATDGLHLLRYSSTGIQSTLGTIGSPGD